MTDSLLEIIYLIMVSLDFIFGFYISTKIFT